MSIFTKIAQQIFASVDETGEPRKISEQEVGVWGTEMERAVSLFISSGGLIYSSKAALDADLAHAPNSMAWVLGDPISANNGVYGKVGASGVGSWTRRADLPFSFIIASDAGTGTPNAIQATTSIPVSGSALVWMNVAQSNTGSPVTVSFDGEPVLTLKTNTGNDISPGGLVAGMIVLGIVSGSFFRLLTDEVSNAIVAAAEAARVAAEAAAASAQGVGFPVAIWDSGRTQTMIGRAKRECHILDFAGPSVLSDRTAEFMNWATQGQTAGVKLVIGSDGSGPADFIIQQEIEITKPGQVIEFDMAGGWMDHEAGIGGIAPNLRLRAAGGVGGWFNTTGKRVRSRRLFRGSAADPQDAPLSALINVQADNVHIIRPSLWLDCDYGVDLVGGLPNLGDYCDVGIFVGSRAAVQIHDPFIKGYFRRASLYVDVTYDSDGPRHLDKTGNPYPNGTPRNGADGIHIYNPRIHGGRVGIAALGALPKVGATTYGDPYYDQQLGTTFADSRGTSGLSDFLVIGGDVYGPDHHSNWRLADPTLSGGTLNQTSLMAEPDNMPAAIHIDGLAGNASGNVWGHRIIGTRISSFEAFRVRLDRSSRDEFVGAHIEGRASSARKSATGVLLTTISATTTNDYSLLAYGDISGTTRTDRTTVIGSPRQSLSDGLAPHYYGSQKPLYITDSGRINIPGYALNEVGSLDLRSASGSAAILRSGTSTVLNAPAAGIASTTTAASPNVYCSGTNILQVSTSTGTLKTDVEDIDPEHRDAILSVRPVWYRSLASADNPEWSWYGLIAEEVAAVDRRLVHWQTEELVIRQVTGEGGLTEEVEEVVPLPEPRPTGVMYDRFVPAILSKLADISKELETLKADNRSAG